jgi:glycosyltransferase involved in cell wall biosynthesis
MITVVIPAYNSSNTIVECIESVLNQTRVDLIEKIIVVNDGSTDDTVSKVQELASENKKIQIITQKNGGVSTARNAGIKASDSEWIALLDSDDVWLPEKIEAQWKEIEAHPEIKFIGCNRNKENVHTGTKISKFLYKLNLKQLLIKMWPHTSTALINHEVFQNVGFFNEKMRYAEDGEFWNRIAIQYPLYYIPVSYEIAGGNKLQFGESGLSANLRGMHDGNISNLKTLKAKRKISIPFYVFLRLFYQAKYLRRIVITAIYKRKK